jgi:cobyrinic acid a,c-diamide synthase
MDKDKTKDKDNNTTEYKRKKNQLASIVEKQHREEETNKSKRSYREITNTKKQKILENPRGVEFHRSHKQVQKNKRKHFCIF